MTTISGRKCLIRRIVSHGGPTGALYRSLTGRRTDCGYCGLFCDSEDCQDPVFFGTGEILGPST